jgi:hypothetical protein
MIKTAVVILNWNTRNHLETFLPSLIRYSTSEDTKIYIADNASSDDSVAFLKQNYPDIELILMDKNYGFAEGYNKALEQIKAQYYIILNSDIEVTENWMDPLISLLERDSTIGACMPKLKSYFDRDSFEYAGAAGGYIDKLGYPFCKGRVFDTVEKDEGQYDGCYEVFWATGACMVVKSDVFHQMGGFDPFYFAHQEEIDLCWRMHNAGYTIFCNTDSVVYHLGGGTLPKSNRHKTFLNFRNNMVLLYKNLPARVRFRVIFFRLILDGVAAVKFLFGPKPSEFLSVIKAHFHFYRFVFSNKKNTSPKTLPTLILNKSIVVQYYLKKKHTYRIISQ